MDISHHFIEKGSGEPLILLHGNGESCDYFSGQIDVFARYFHVYALDTRGHGQTPRGTAPFTIRQFADDLLAFMDAQVIDRAHLLGFSDGGNIAMIFALKDPGADPGRGRDARYDPTEAYTADRRQHPECATRYPGRRSFRRE